MIHYNLGQKNDNLPVLLIDFLDYLMAVKGKSVNTIDGYRIDLSMFLKFMKIRKRIWNENDNIEDVAIYDIDADFISSINLSDIYAFINYITIVRHNGTHARARKTAAIKSFYKYLVNKVKVIKENPALELETPKIRKSQPIYLTLEQSRKLLTSIDGTYKERNFAIITLFLNCGLRLSELIGIDTNDIKEDKLKVKGKGNKERVVYLNKACLSALHQYIGVRNSFNVDTSALFLSERKKRISKRTVQHIVQKYIEKAGISDNKYSVHKLRHTAATLMYKYGNVDIRLLQEILGHENVSTTQIYTHVDDEKLRSAINSNPLSDI